MSGIQSIYRKDYLWPVRKLYFPRTDFRCSVAAPVSPKENDPRQADKDRSACTSEEAPSPKLGACPKTETLEFSEIDACLKKVYRYTYTYTLIVVLQVLKLIRGFTKLRFTDVQRKSEYVQCHEETTLERRSETIQRGEA